MENKCTLVVVDFQYDFCTGGSLPVPGSDMALARIKSEKDFVKECASHSDIDFELTSEEQKSYFY